jgi:hypothetical protein
MLFYIKIPIKEVATLSCSIHHYSQVIGEIKTAKVSMNDECTKNMYIDNYLAIKITFCHLQQHSLEQKDIMLSEISQPQKYSYSYMEAKKVDLTEVDIG